MKLFKLQAGNGQKITLIVNHITHITLDKDEITIFCGNHSCNFKINMNANEEYNRIISELESV